MSQQPTSSPLSPAATPAAAAQSPVCAPISALRDPYGGAVVTDEQLGRHFAGEEGLGASKVAERLRSALVESTTFSKKDGKTKPIVGMWFSVNPVGPNAWLVPGLLLVGAVQKLTADSRCLYLRDVCDQSFDLAKGGRPVADIVDPAGDGKKRANVLVLPEKHLYFYLPASGKDKSPTRARHALGVQVIAVDVDDGSVVVGREAFVADNRDAMKRGEAATKLSFPAGGCEADQLITQCGSVELAEESGYIARREGSVEIYHQSMDVDRTREPGLFHQIVVPLEHKDAKGPRDGEMVKIHKVAPVFAVRSSLFSGEPMHWRIHACRALARVCRGKGGEKAWNEAAQLLLSDAVERLVLARLQLSAASVVALAAHADVQATPLGLVSDGKVAMAEAAELKKQAEAKALVVAEAKVAELKSKVEAIEKDEIGCFGQLVSFSLPNLVAKTKGGVRKELRYTVDPYSRP